MHSQLICRVAGDSCVTLVDHGDGVMLLCCTIVTSPRVHRHHAGCFAVLRRFELQSIDSLVDNRQVYALKTSSLSIGAGNEVYIREEKVSSCIMNKFKVDVRAGNIFLGGSATNVFEVDKKQKTCDFQREIWYANWCLWVFLTDFNDVL